MHAIVLIGIISPYRSYRSYILLYNFIEFYYIKRENVDNSLRKLPHKSTQDRPPATTGDLFFSFFLS